MKERKKESLPCTQSFHFYYCLEKSHFILSFFFFIDDDRVVIQKWSECVFFINTYYIPPQFELKGIFHYLLWTGGVNVRVKSEGQVGRITFCKQTSLKIIDGS